VGGGAGSKQGGQEVENCELKKVRGNESEGRERRRVGWVLVGLEASASGNPGDASTQEKLRDALESGVSCCLAMPGYFSQAQRQGRGV
jgi:hypothetical protein